ncbi:MULTISPECIES: type II toxin-antitoxin system HicA family toxin [Microcoleaceae]|uniref:type II toxin-antitoxin system HicA family toxin n=1 Tax=Microcoleaceae TaxID=1892252 RepID=UPI001880153C|nr:type II toxin-antitoxin system HicA family toxin [Tychonema sp. LEGE 06208]MBE9161755.1 type II toxin-antitoxin system HicA family toxin [Tychonema sp. LEGE 06208]
MKSISGKRLGKILEHKGWVLRRITGSHHIYENPEIDQILSIPVHRNQDLKVGTLKALMKIAQLSEEDLQSLS